MKPTFIGLGAQKCASTWLHRVLADHPQAFLSEPKEIDFFSYYFGRGYDWYERFFAAASGRLAVGEVSPSYLPHPLAPARAARYNPDFKILLAVRDPVERAYSNHLHMVREGYLTGPDLSFEYGLARNEMYVEQSRYATHLKCWLRHFALERVLVVFQEDISAAPHEQAQRLYRFLGIDDNFRSEALDQRTNASARARHGGVATLIKCATTLADRIGLGGVVSAAKKSSLGKSLRAMNQEDLRALVPPMRDETRARLVNEFRVEMVDLAQLLGRNDLPWKSWQQCQK